MKKALIFIIMISLFFSGYQTVNAQGIVSINLSSTESDLATGEFFDIQVMINPEGYDLDTIRLNVQYPAEMIEVTSYEIAELFPEESPGNSIDNQNGLLSQGAYKLGGGVTDQGLVGTITFRALSAGVAEVFVRNDSRAISAGQEMLGMTETESVLIEIMGDTVPAVAESVITITLQDEAIADFIMITGHEPETDADWLAIDYMINGYFGYLSLGQEQKALDLYVSIFDRVPSSVYDWNTIAAIAYAGSVLEWNEIGPLTPEEEALIYFGAFFARMPADSADWQAVHCIAYGGCQANPQDVSAELLALSAFGAKYEKMPSNGLEWNVIHVLAYLDL